MRFSGCAYKFTFSLLSCSEWNNDWPAGIMYSPSPGSSQGMSWHLRGTCCLTDQELCLLILPRPWKKSWVYFMSSNSYKLLLQLITFCLRHPDRNEGWDELYLPEPFTFIMNKGQSSVKLNHHSPCIPILRLHRGRNF